MKKTLAVFGLLLLAAVVSPRGNARWSFAAASAAGPAEVEVKIENFLYDPTPLTVPVGTTVRWTNRDMVPHDVVSEDKSFKSKLMAKDEQFLYTFSKAGTFNYVCSIHRRMAARVIVH